MLGFGDKATELYRMINPIEHARTKEASKKYKVEPYVIAADVYGASNLAGQGGWTWYTGSSSWYYKAGIEYILGLKIEKGYMKIEPCIPKEWKEYQIQYKWKESIYNIRIKNTNGKNMGVSEIKLNGEKIENYIKLDGYIKQLENIIKIKNEKERTKYVELVAKLDAFSPLKTLTRGYSITEKNGNIIKTSKELNKGDIVSIKFIDGNKEATIN